MNIEPKYKTYKIGFYKFRTFLENQEDTYFGLPYTDECIIRKYIKSLNKTIALRGLDVTAQTIRIEHRIYLTPVWMFFLIKFLQELQKRHKHVMRVKKETYLEMFQYIPRFMY